MNFRLRTSTNTEEKLKQLQAYTSITPNILARIAVSISLKDPTPATDIVVNSNGIDFNRNTLTGEYDYIYKALIAQHAKSEITDEEYFPTLFNAHLERGIGMLENEYHFAGNYDKFIASLIKQ